MGVKGTDLKLAGGGHGELRHLPACRGRSGAAPQSRAEVGALQHVDREDVSGARLQPVPTRHTHVY